MSSFRYAFWLLPCAEDGEVLRTVIRSLAARCAAPEFSPHATLCSGVWKSGEAELVAAGSRLARPLPVVMQADGVGWTERWSTFFFMRLSGANDLFERAAVEGAHVPAVGPHVSLLYGLGESAVERSALPPEIRFDSLALVRPGSDRWDDVKHWRIVHRY